VVPDPVLPAAYLPEKVGSAGERAELEGEFTSVEPYVLGCVFEPQVICVISDACGYFVDRGIQSVLRLFPVEFSPEAGESFRECFCLVLEVIDVAAGHDVLQCLFDSSDKQVDLPHALSLCGERCGAFL